MKFENIKEQFLSGIPIKNNLYPVHYFIHDSINKKIIDNSRKEIDYGKFALLILISDDWEIYE